MTTEGNESMELDCYEAVEAIGHHKSEVIHLGMDVQEIEGGQTYWNVYVPTKWDHGQRLLLVSEEEFNTISMVLSLEAFVEPQYSHLSKEMNNTLDNLIAPMGKFHSTEPIHQCPDCQTVLIRLGPNHWVCDRCAVTLDSDFEMVALIEDEAWIEMDTQTLEFDDALGIVRNEAMEIIAFPDWLASQMVLDGDHFELKETVEVAQAYEDYGGANHSNHDDYQE